jgi:hypothetical protein
MTDPKALIHDALRLARAVGGPTYYDQLLGKAGADADADLTPGGRAMGRMTGASMPMGSGAGGVGTQPEPIISMDGGGGGGDGSLGGLGDAAPGGGYGGSPGDSAGGSPAGDGGGTMGGAMARGGKADKMHPARQIPGFHIRSEEMGQPVFFYGDK